MSFTARRSDEAAVEPLGAAVARDAAFLACHAARGVGIAAGRAHGVVSPARCEERQREHERRNDLGQHDLLQTLVFVVKNSKRKLDLEPNRARRWADGRLSKDDYDGAWPGSTKPEAMQEVEGVRRSKWEERGELRLLAKRSLSWNRRQLDDEEVRLIAFAAGGKYRRLPLEARATHWLVGWGLLGSLLLGRVHAVGTRRRCFVRAGLVGFR